MKIEREKKKKGIGYLVGLTSIMISNFAEKFLHLLFCLFLLAFSCFHCWINLDETNK